MEFFFFLIFGFLALLGSMILVWYVSSRPKADKPEFLLNDVQGRAKERIEKRIHDAEGKTEKIIMEAESTRSEIEQKFENSLRTFFDTETEKVSSAIEQISREYRIKTTEFEDAYVKLIADVSKTVSLEAERAVAEFKNFVKLEMSRYERLTDQGLEEWRRAMQTEVEKKKALALKKVEESIYRILFFVSKEVLGKAINLEEHQSLVVRALEEAKREGFFDI